MMIISEKQLAELRAAPNIRPLNEQICNYICSYNSLSHEKHPLYLPVIDILIQIAKDYGFKTQIQQFNFVIVAFIFGRRFYETIPALREVLNLAELSSDEKINWLFIVSRECFKIGGVDVPDVKPGFGGTLAHHFQILNAQIKRDTLYLLGLDTDLTVIDHEIM